LSSIITDNAVSAGGLTDNLGQQVIVEWGRLIKEAGIRIE